MTSPAPAVHTDALVKGYGPVRALDGVDVSVRPGTITALLGPNGAGKTTFVECCVGLRRPSSGTIRVLGAAPGSVALRPRVGVMLQEGSGLYASARARELVGHLAGLYAHPLDVGALFDRLGLAGVARSTVRRLSGGERQRLALAAAIVGRPELVVLDEPTAGLDPHARADVLALVSELRDDGVTVLLTTHQITESEHLYDDVVLIDRGRVVVQGTPADLVGDAATVRFTGPPRLPLDELLAALPPDVAAIEPTPGRYRVEGHVDPSVLATVGSWCARHGVGADGRTGGITVGRRGLEDVFLELTGRELP